MVHSKEYGYKIISHLPEIGAIAPLKTARPLLCHNKHGAVMSLHVLETQDYIPIWYETGDYQVSFKLAFGPGKISSEGLSDSERRVFMSAYDAHRCVLIDQGVVDWQCWVVVGNEGPVLVKIFDMGLKRLDTGETCQLSKYAIGFVMDTNVCAILCRLFL